MKQNIFVSLFFSLFKRLVDAYRGYVFTAKIEEDNDVIFVAIKSEHNDDSKAAYLAEQVMTVSQSNANDHFDDNNEHGSITDMAPTETPEPDHDGMKFYCTHCQDANFRNDVYDNVQEVHNHWHMKHAKWAPFQFYVGYSCICIVCKERIRISEIKNHFQLFHPKQQFGMANRLDENKCAICEYSGNHLAEHFLGSHQIVIEGNLFNPMRLTKDDLNYLSNIEVHKKYRCKYCEQIFETKHEAKCHKCQYANGELEEFSDKRPPYFECGLCGCHIMQRSQLKRHFAKEHDFECWNCDLVEENLDALIVHHNEAHSGLSMEKTKFEMGKAYFQSKIIFGNGLILNNANGLHATDSEYDKIQDFFASQSSTPLSIDKIPTATCRELNAMATPEQLAKDNFIENNKQTESNAMATPELFAEDDLTEKKKQIELENQKKLITSVIVCGIIADNDHEFQDAFLKLCKHIEVSIDSDDIQNIKILSSKTVVVKFRERPKKELLVNAPQLKGLKSDDFLQLPPGRKPEPIYVNPSFSKIYKKIDTKARAYFKKKRIHSYRIGSQGYTVKMVQGGKEHHIRSVKELDDLVEGKVFYQPKRKCNEVLQTIIPKQIKFA